MDEPVGRTRLVTKPEIGGIAEDGIDLKGVRATAEIPVRETTLPCVHPFPKPFTPPVQPPCANSAYPIIVAMPTVMPFKVRFLRIIQS